MVGEAIEAADGREPPVDGGGGEAALLHPRDVELDLRPSHPENLEL
jgi:hypothetical protein